jgi:hypothetical protein
MKRVAFILVILAACLSCKKGKNLIISKHVLEQNEWASLDEIQRMKSKLQSLRVDLPSGVPLTLPCILQHLNARLNQEHCGFQLAVYSEPTFSESDWYVSFSIMDLKDMSYFSNSTEAELRREINKESAYYCITKLRQSYGGLNALYFRQMIVITPTIGGPDYKPGYEIELNRRKPRV